MRSDERVAVLTSGGDAPGMNAALRAVVRTSVHHGMEIFGVMRGYQGLIDDEFEQLNARSVSNMIQRGGTMLRTSRCSEFHKESGREKAADHLRRNEITSLILIGGEGTFQGAIKLSEQWDGKIIGVPGTIDNDIYGTDFTIGFDTAINTALDAIDKIRDTAEAHERTFIIEVMGRDAGFIALDVGIGGGAEEIDIPEIPTDIPAMIDRIKAARERGKRSLIIVVAEGTEHGGAQALAESMKAHGVTKTKVCILGHLQRGGSPSAADRVLATKLGVYAVESAKENEHLVMVGEHNGKLVRVSLAEAVGKKKPVNHFLRELTRILSA